MNELASNTSKRVAKVFASSFESNRVLSKTVNTQMMKGDFQVTPDTGDTVYLKRPAQYKAVQTVDGDISGETKNKMGIGNASATVQEFITVPIEYPNLEEVTELNQLQEILAPAAEELCTTLELNVGQKLQENAGLTYGTPGNPVDNWEEVAGSSALGTSIGMPKTGERYYVMGPFSEMKLASAQSGLDAADDLVRSAWNEATIRPNFAGMRAMSSNALKNLTTGDATDRAGTLASTPIATWVAHKDTMIQTLSLSGLSANATVTPGEVIEFTGTNADARSYINVLNRQVAMGADGAPIKWRATVVTGGTTDGSGNVTVTVTNAAIAPTGGSPDILDSQYQSISTALQSGDNFSILGAASTTYQPNLFYHKNAFALSSIPLPRLHATDMMVKSKDGMQIRISKYSDGDKNLQRWRADLLPVMGVINPLFIGKGYGV